MYVAESMVTSGLNLICKEHESFAPSAIADFSQSMVKESVQSYNSIFYCQQALLQEHVVWRRRASHRLTTRLRRCFQLGARIVPFILMEARVESFLSEIDIAEHPTCMGTSLE